MQGIKVGVAVLIMLVICGTGIAFGAQGDSPAEAPSASTQALSEPPAEAVTSAGKASPGAIEVPDAEPNQPPDAHAVSIGIAEYEREQAEREKWLTSPEAVKQREASWLAFSEVTTSESENLLRTLFAEQLEALNGDPSRYLSDAQLVRPIEEAGGVVRDESGTSLLESNLPVRVEDESGDLRKVDLTLESTPEGFKTANALAEVVLPRSGDELMRVGEKGFGIAQAGAAESQANRFGDKNLFYPEVLPDSDLFVAVTSSGVELFNLLRSRESPEELRFEIEVPPGAELRADDLGGAEVVREGKILTRIRRPSAVDAQGTDVPVHLTVEQSSILLRVPHREMDLAYPALVDPIIEDWANAAKSWYYGNSLGELPGPWEFDGSGNSNIEKSTCCWGGSHQGLLTKFKAAFFGPEQKGQWSYNTGNPHIYIPHAWITPFSREDKNCGSQQPHDYAGMWSPGWWNPLKTDEAKKWGALSMDGLGQWLVLGMSSGPPGVWLACDRLLYVGGVAIWLDDVYPPAISVSGIPTGWFSDEDVQSINVNANDEGLGIQRTQLNPAGKPVIKDEPGCSGYWHSRCPTSRPSHFTPSGKSFSEGIQDFDVVSADPTGKTAEQDFETKVDYSPPKVTLNGQLAEATKEVGNAGEEDPGGWDKLRLPVYELDIKAEDGVWETTDNEAKRSGVKDIKVFLDGVERTDVPWDPNPSCPETSCKLEGTYTLALSELDTAGKHKLEVKVEDFAENLREREIEFEYFPATGMKDEYVMHYFPLPNGQGNEDEEENPVRPELAVNVMNGNLVYRERDIDVDGTAGVDLEVERYYNSQLPTAEDTEWGDGWTLAQTPDLEPIDTGGSSAPDEAALLDSSGVFRDGVSLPSEAGATKFDSAMRASLSMRAGGGYEMADETGESATSVVFDETGQTEARLTEGYAKVDYTYEGGDLAEIEVTDPSTFAADPEELQIPEPPPFSEPSFAYAFGLFGDGEGEFEAPADVAVGPEGDIWVVDAENERIQHFSRFGQYLDEFGSEGYGDGQLRHPVAIEIDQDGHLWVLDSYNDRVQKFNPQGEFLAKWGTYGKAAGQLDTPEGMAIDADGNFWIADTLNDRLQKFSPTGALLKVTGTSGPGDLSEPVGLDVGPGGEVFVADKADNRVVAFDTEGAYLRHFGSVGYGEGQFHGPLTVEVDTRGSVWVLDGSDEQLEQFDTDGNFIAQFGSEGTGQGEFEFERPAGITTDARGGIWIVDSGNYRLQRWTRGQYRPSYEATVGSPGTGNGQLNLPGDIDIDSEGDIWVIDTLNNRVQQLDPEGNFISKFGTLGSANGQLNRPSAIEIDAEDKIWVADAGNDRLQKFNQAGQYLATLGASGTAEGKLDSPEGIAIDQGGDIWVSDTWNDRVQRFSAAGTFEKALGTTGEGQLLEPLGLDVLYGEVYVADWQHHRIAVFDEAGTYLREFGAEGYGLGEFRFPNALEIDDSGNVWVGDEGNERILQFNVEGEFVTDFGSEGTGEGEFELASPSGVATDPEGGIWVTDSANDRLQRWENPGYVAAPEPELTDGDPEVEIETPGGLVSSVSGNAAGEHDYAHEGDLLVAHDGPEGEVDYDYDEERLSKVTLPNGTWAEIKYEAIGRAEEVTVSIEGGASKATHFLYKDDAPRRTIVTPSDAPHVTYDIGEDGSVLKWWNTQKPPTIDAMTGTLSDFREKDGGLWAGPHTLNTKAFSAEGIASIKVIANGNVLVDEKTCEEDKKTEAIECEEEENEWVTETELHPPGHLNLEVIVTDHIGGSTSERFWVDIPPPPPPLALGTPVPPKFRDIAKFREEFGLEVVFPVANEVELNKRIFNLIKAWYEPGTPAGQVARASMDRWGVPMRPADVAEMEYREWYMEHNGQIIQQWGEDNHANAYAGYWLDHRQGGIMRVGFTSNQASTVSDLSAVGQLVAVDRIGEFTVAPSHSISELVSLQAAIGIEDGSQGPLQGLITRAGVDIPSNHVTVGATSPSTVTAGLNNHYGSGIPIAVHQDQLEGAPNSVRTPDRGPVKAGLRIGWWTGELGPKGKIYKVCGAGPPAREVLAERRPNGGKIVRNFLITAGHCYEDGQIIERFHDVGFDSSSRIGVQGDRRWQIHSDQKIFESDGAAIRLDSGVEVSAKMIGGRPTAGAGPIEPGKVVCMSLAMSDHVRCNAIKGIAEVFPFYFGTLQSGPFWQVPTAFKVEDGDSGSPVYSPRTDRVLGIEVHGPPAQFTPLLPPPLPGKGDFPYFVPDRSQAEGLLKEPFMGDIHLVKED